MSTANSITVLIHRRLDTRHNYDYYYYFLIAGPCQVLKMRFERNIFLGFVHLA